MAGVERLVLALQEVSFPGDLPGECDLGQILKEFFLRPEVKTVMINMNQSQLFDEQLNRYGTILGTYADKTARHKRRRGLPDVHYTYYETGKTYDSLEVYADDESVGIFPDESAPDYANYALDGSAWGLNNENFAELVPEMRDAVVDGIRNFLNNG